MQGPNHRIWWGFGLRGLADSVYRIPETFVTKYGRMWGYRWAAERGVKVDGRREPVPPDWILQAGNN